MRFPGTRFAVRLALEVALERQVNMTPHPPKPRPDEPTPGPPRPDPDPAPAPDEAPDEEHEKRPGRLSPTARQAIDLISGL